MRSNVIGLEIYVVVYWQSPRPELQPDLQTTQKQRQRNEQADLAIKMQDSVI